MGGGTLGATFSDAHFSLHRQKLGRVLQVLEDFDAAAECLTTSVELESTSPVTPFTVIPKQLQV